jgi:hypothetical protein
MIIRLVRYFAIFLDHDSIQTAYFRPVHKCCSLYTHMYSSLGLAQGPWDICFWFYSLVLIYTTFIADIDKAACAATDLAILAPGISRACAVCGLRCLINSELSRLAQEHYGSEVVVAESAGTCGRCGGKFVV